MLSLEFIALLQVIFTWTMVGISAFSQIVHYPLYDEIKEGFVHYERKYLKRVAFLLGPLMLLEAVTAIALVGYAYEGVVARLAVINMILLIFIWLATFLLSVYQHQRLSIRYSRHVLHELISSNWISTILWFAKGLVLITILWSLIQG